MDRLSSRLKSVVDQSVSILGELIQKEWGAPSFRQIESTRRAMAGLRGEDFAERRRVLQRQMRVLTALSRAERRRFASAYTLMLEVMNACENAYRSASIQKRALRTKDVPDSIIYVLTAHPTEARSPENIWIFHQLQIYLAKILGRPDCTFTREDHDAVFHLLAMAIKISIVRERKPRVRDEAEHIYSTLLREETLSVLLAANRDLVPVYLRSWVGGDKDGHPGVDKKAFLESLQLSRSLLVPFVHRRLKIIEEALRSMEDSRDALASLASIFSALAALKKIRAGDGKKVRAFRASLREFAETYKGLVCGAEHPALSELLTLAKIFPALVVPLEFRESSDILMSYPKTPNIAVAGMLGALEQISRGTDCRWYVRGFIISMASSIDHVRMAARIIQEKLRGLSLPIVPLFEQAAALKLAPTILTQMIDDRALARARKKFAWGPIEIMVGYSDSSKESGVLASRLEIANSMHFIDRLSARKKVVPLFFQGSGGSIDRGGGSIAEQTAWWPSGALRNYKVTIQGEMVERSLASPEITLRQLERIAESAGRWKKEKGRRLRNSPQVKAFAARVADAYREIVHDPSFLRVIEHATPYPFLNVLRIGSRPAKRTTTLSVEGLRAIPWVMCWTQTRVLFPVWWGVGGAWEAMSAADKKKLKSAFPKDPVFSVFVRALGFTLAKVDLAVWSLYLEHSGLDVEERDAVLNKFRREKIAVERFYAAIVGRKKMREKSWLRESIYLRTPMIHPLNLLQILAVQDKDDALLRITVTGISSGMLTTG